MSSSVEDILADARRQIGEGALDVLGVMGAVDQLNRNGAMPVAATLYQQWVERNLGHPLLYTILYNLGSQYSALLERELAIAAFQAAINANAGFVPAYINLGLMLEQTGNLQAAASTWQSAIERLAAITPEAIDGKLNALKHLGRVLADANLDDAAEETFRASLALNPRQPDVIVHWINVRQRQCRWPVVEPFASLSTNALLRDISPLSLAAYRDDPLWQLANAAHYTKTTIEPPAAILPDRDVAWRDAAGKRPLRIGYLSSDLCNHAVGFLTAEIFALHDRSKVEIFVYYTGWQSDRISQRIEGAADHWRDLRGLSELAAAQRIHDDKIAILVDLNGHTKGSQISLLAYRPAPVIVNWLGYPGTMGSAFHHYIIADDFIIPEGDDLYYSEKVKRLPCYQPTDRQRLVGRPIERAEVGLPEDALVYCCFNEPRKISDESWACWVEILKQVPDSVLWLMVPAVTTQQHLRDKLTQADIDPARLVFAERWFNEDHLTRYPLADIVLDTFPYGAHTTASDALWMGVPVLSRVGKSFAARVCGSLLRAAGLAELACESDADYVAKAVALGKAQAELARLKERLRQNRDACILFDTPALVSALEQLYREMWHDCVAGALPRPDLSNLDAYADVAVALTGPPPDRDAYHRRYRERLDTISHYRFIGPDPRLMRD